MPPFRRRLRPAVLGANPLQEIRDTTRIEGVAVGVAVGGRWLGRAELDSLLARARTRYGGG